MARRFVLVVLLLAFLAPALAAQESCDSLKAERDKVKKALDKLEADKLPEDKLADLDNILGQIIDLLNSNSGDQAEVKKKIDELTKQLPQSDSGLLKSVKDFTGAVSGGLGGSADAQKNAAEFLSDVRARINTIKDFYTAGDEATAGRQIEAFGKFFDDMTGVLPIKDIPGLGKLFGAYSQAIHGIAISAGKIDEQMAIRRQIAMNADELGRDFSPRGKTAREKRADQLNTLHNKLHELDGKIADAKCDKPADEPVDVCADPKSRVVQDMRALHHRFDPQRAEANKSNCSEELYSAMDFAKKKQASGLTAAQRAEYQRLYELHNKRYYECESQAYKDRQALDKQEGDLLDMVSKNEKWTPAEEKLLADCFPEEHELLKQSRLRPKNVPPPDKYKDLPKKQDTNTAKTPTNPPKDLPPCKGTGLSGIVEDVANKDAGKCK